MPAGKFTPVDRALLAQIARRIVHECHSKTEMGLVGYKDTPIGKGGKVDDTCCVVGEVVEWTANHSELWTRVQRNKAWSGLFACGGHFQKCSEHQDEYDQEMMHYYGKAKRYPG